MTRLPSDQQIDQAFRAFERRSVADMLGRFGNPATVRWIAGEKWYLWAYRMRRTESPQYQVFSEHSVNPVPFETPRAPSTTLELHCQLAARVDEQEIVAQIDWRGTRGGCSELAGM